VGEVLLTTFAWLN